MKAPQAFRSISEVAAALGVRQHTLRAWETRFPFVKPIKRPDGRRYYRPSDVAMLARLGRLLTDEGLSTQDIMVLHRAGGLVVTPTPDRDALGRLRGHLAALTSVRRRLAAILG